MSALMKRNMLVAVTVLLAVCLGSFFASAATSKGKITISHWSPLDVVESEITKDYMKKNPGVTIEWSRQPWQDYYTWLHTQLVGNRAPEVFQLHSMPFKAGDYARTGYIKPLDKFYNETNPYTGNIWRNDFAGSALTDAKAGTRQLVTIPFNAVKTAIYYNVNLFKTHGLATPDTWEEFITIQKKFKGASYIPFGIQLDPTVTVWLPATFGDIFYGDKLESLDRNNDTFVDQEEMARGIQKGIIDPVKDPAHKAAWELMKDWTNYWWRGFASTEKGWYRSFLEGKVPMTWEGIWGINTFDKDLKDLGNPFPYGIFAFPAVTKETSKYSHGQKTEFYVVGVAFALNTRASDAEQQTAVDFFRFLLRPDNMKKYLKGQINLPVVKGVDEADHPAVQAFLKTDARNVNYAVVQQLDPEWQSKFTSDLQMYLTGVMPIDQFLKELDKNNQAGVKRLIAKQKYDTSRW